MYKIIRDKVKELGLTQAKVCEETGIPTSTLSCYLSGKNDLTSINFIKLVKFLKIEL